MKKAYSLMGAFMITTILFAQDTVNLSLSSPVDSNINAGISVPKEIHYTLYEPKEQEINGTILILHGMQEHSGRYSEFAKFLSDQGFVVLTYDHLGHGKTAKSSNDLGFFVKKNPKNRIVNDAESMADLIEKQYPNVPHFILGHSMGSFIARCLLQQASHRFNGAIIVGTGGKTKGAKLGKAYFSILNKISPKHRGKFNETFGRMNNKRFKNEGNDRGTNWLSVDKQNRNNFLQDSLCGVPFTNNGFYTLLSLNVQATKRNWAKNISHEFPFLFISGEDDPIGDFGKGVKKTVLNLQKDGFKDVSIKLYPNTRHEILNEEIKDEVFLDILSWIQSLSWLTIYHALYN